MDRMVGGRDQAARRRAAHERPGGCRQPGAGRSPSVPARRMVGAESTEYSTRAVEGELVRPCRRRHAAAARTARDPCRAGTLPGGLAAGERGGCAPAVVTQGASMTESPGQSPRQIEPAEVRHAAELVHLAKSDPGARPPGWVLTPRSVVTFIAGSAGKPVKAGGKSVVIAPK